VIAFGLCVSSEETYAAHAGPGIPIAAGPDAVVIKLYGQSSLFEGYNSILEEAARLPGLQGLVLLHDDLEIRDAQLLDKLRGLFAGDTIGLAGAVGARSVRSINWWEGERHGRVIWDGVAGEEGPRVEDFGAETTDVEAVDGLMMALSPWVVRNVRFDSHTFHGFSAADVDYCFTVRQRGRARGRERLRPLAPQPDEAPPLRTALPGGERPLAREVGHLAVLLAVGPPAPACGAAAAATAGGPEASDSPLARTPLSHLVGLTRPAEMRVSAGAEG